MPTFYIIIHPNSHSVRLACRTSTSCTSNLDSRRPCKLKLNATQDSDAAPSRFTSPGEQEGAYTVHMMTGNATPKPEIATGFPSKLSRSSTAAPVLVTAPAPSIPGAVDGLQETPVAPVMTHAEEGKTVGLRSSDAKLPEEPAAEVSDQAVESSESETSPAVANVEENYGPTEPLGEAALPSTEDKAKATRHSAVIPSSATKPYQTGIQVPSQIRIADGFPYPPGLAAYDILEEDWNKFTTHLITLISPHSKWVKNIPIRLVPPFGVRDEKLDFQKSLSKVFEYVRASQNKLFRPKGLLMRVDIPGEGVGMESMDLYHRSHVDHLSNTAGALASETNAAPTADGEEIDTTTEEAVAHGNVAQTPLYPNRARDKTLENARKKQQRTLGHLNSAQDKMSKRIRIVMEPVTVLDNPERSEKNGWNAWIRHCDNYGSQLSN